MKTRYKLKKDAAPEPAVYRLTDMIVEEVSAVDRAANKRSFIVVKSASPAPTPAVPGELIETPSGDLSVSKAPEPPEQTPASQPEPTSPEAPPVPSATNTPEAPNGTVLRLSPETKAELSTRLDGVAAQLAKLVASVTGAEEVQGLTEVPQEVIDGVAELVTTLNSGVTKSAVEKGRKQISMARESKIRAAHKELGDLVAELDEPAPNATSETEPAPNATTKAEVVTGERIDKRDVLLSKLVDLTEKQSSAITKQAARLATLERGRPASNAGVVESMPAKVTKSSETAWPLDMNSTVNAGASVDGDFTSR